jgi:multidrug efflux system outer membrane protein
LLQAAVPCHGGYLLIFCRKILTCFGQGEAATGSRLPFTRKLAQVVFFGLIAVSFSGCAIKRSGYDVPEVPLPDQYRNSPSESSPASTTTQIPAETKAEISDSSQDIGMVEWWRAFGNAELSALIDRGIANNPDVRIATLKIAQVKARADQVRADQVPAVSAGVGESIQAPGGQVGSVPVGTDSNKVSQKLYQASIRGNWRIDLWGEQSSLAESAGLQVWQAAFERDNVQRSMLANLASSYIEYLSLNDRLRIAQEADLVLSGVLATIEKRVEVGDATIIELEQQKAAIFAVRATIPTLEQQREDAITSIAFLVGTVPGALSLSGDGLDTLLLPTVVPALPSALILRRPDVRSMEAKLLAADADVDVARARILPPLDLSAQVGYSSLAMSGLFQPVSLFWNAISNLTVSIFDSGKLSSQKDQAKFVHEEMVESYAKTIYQAVREVESALAAIRLTAKRFDAQQEATTAAQRAWDSSNDVYAVGGLDHLTLLDSGRTYLRFLDDYQRIKMDRYRGYVSLFQALGGGADFGEVIPGKGVRPTPVRSRFSTSVSVPAAKKIASIDGVEWEAGRALENGEAWRVESFWQVELPGLYHRVAIGPAWRDLRNRYPKLMEGRIVRPRLTGRIEDSVDGQASWYRLYVAKFSTPLAAGALCAALKANYQRCRVVSSTSDDTVLVAAASLKDEDTSFPKPEKTDTSLQQASKVIASQPAEDDLSSKRLPFVEVKAPTAEPTVQATRPEAVKEKLAYTIQLGAFSNLENAAISYAFWRFRKYDVYVSEIKDAEGRVWYAVRTGIFPQRRDASVAAASLRRKESAPAVMMPTMVDRTGKPNAIAVGDLKLPSSASVAPVVPEPPEAPVDAASKAASAPSSLSDERREAFAYSVQLGAFSAVENAAVSFSFWQSRGYEVFVTEVKDADGRSWYAVRTGVFLQRDDASASALFFGRGEDAPAVVVSTPVDKSGLPKTVDMTKFMPVTPVVESRDSAVATAGKMPVKNGSKTEPTSAHYGVFKGGRAYAVQLAAFSSLENAGKSLSEWQGRGHKAYVCEIQDASRPVRYAVRIGAFAQRREAAALVRSLARKESVRAILVPAVLDRTGRLAVVDVLELAQSTGGEN